MALGPLKADNDTILVALRNHSTSSGSNGSNSSGFYEYSYHVASLDRRNPQDSPPKVAAAVFWCALPLQRQYNHVENQSYQTVQDLCLVKWPQDDTEHTICLFVVFVL